jgi:ABC-type glycerol-3-phosphate transport system permease component
VKGAWRRPGAYLVAIYIAIHVVFVTFPILWLVLGSIKSRFAALRSPPTLFFEPTYEAFGKIFAGGLVGVFGNSVTIGAINVALALLLGVPAAYALARMRGPVRKNVAFWILSIRLAPAFGLVIPLYALMRGLGLLDTLAAVVIAHLTINLPFAIWLMMSYFDDLPVETEEAAVIDGANRFQVLWHVLLPVSAPMLVAVSMLVFVFSWNEFLFAFILTSSDAQTVPALIASLAGTMSFDWPLISALSVSALLPALLVVVIAQRFIAKGLTMGSVQ